MSPFDPNYPFSAKAVKQFIRDRIARWGPLRLIAGNTLWLFGDRILRLGLGLYLNIRIAQYLGPHQFGLLNYATAFTTLFLPIATLGFDSIVVRDLVRAPHDKDEILGTVLRLRLIGSVVAMALITGSILLVRPNDFLVHWLVGVTAIGTVFLSFDAIDLWFQSRLQSRLTVYAKNAAFLLIGSVKLLLIAFGASLITFAWAATAELLLGAIGMMIAYRTQGFRLLDWRMNLERTIGLLRGGWPLVLSGFASYLQSRSDQVLIGDLAGDAELGQYSVALRLVEVLGFIPMILYSSVAPTAARVKAEDETRYYRILLNFYRLMFLLFVLTAAPLLILSRQLIEILFGQEYAPAGLLLPLFSIRLFFTNFGVAKNLFIINDGLFKFSLIATCIGAFTNLGLNFMLIPGYSSKGAILAMSISYLLSTFLIDIFYSKARKNLYTMVMAILTPWKIQFSTVSESALKSNGKDNI